MFKWIKKLFGEETPEPLILTNPIKHEHEVKVAARPADLPLPAAPTPAPLMPPIAVKKVEKPVKKSTKKNGYTVADLEKLSKKEIGEISEKEFGLKLDRRKKKESMIDDFLAAQK